MSGPERVGGLAAVRTVADLRQALAPWRGASIALVPTMGALHRGHLALVERARALCPKVVASLFVNPAQFGPGEDFTRYPRDEAADAEKLRAAGCDLLYAPAVDAIYPPGFSVTVDPGPLAEPLCGRFRPGHFKGVATVVAKLFLEARPDVACFGEKDFQQLQIVRRLVRDLDLEVRIEAVPIVREPDGLALSSRNAYLSAAERAMAPALHRILAATASRVSAGEDPRSAEAEAAAALLGAGFAKVDYVAVAEEASLRPLERPGPAARVLAAAWLGRTRLIDNLALPAPQGGAR